MTTFAPLLEHFLKANLANFDNVSIFFGKLQAQVSLLATYGFGVLLFPQVLLIVASVGLEAAGVWVSYKAWEVLVGEMDLATWQTLAKFANRSGNISKKENQTISENRYVWKIH